MTWLVAIGLTNAVVASLLAVIAWGVGRSCRRPALTRLLWIIVLCKLLAPPLAKAPVGDWLAAPRRWLSQVPAVTVVDRDRSDTVSESASGDAAASNAKAPVTRSTAVTGGAIASSGPRGTMAHSRSWRTYLRPFISFTNLIHFAAVIWICGSAACLVWMAYRAWRFRDFLAWAAIADEELTRRVAQLAKRVGLQSAPTVFIVEGVVSPMLWGAGRRARLLFPLELTRRIDADARDTLLLHELAHYARSDWAVRLLELAVQVVYWWHPLVGWARREIEAVEEECCDAWVVRHQTGSRRTYAEALLTTVDFLCEPIRPLPPAACGLGAAPLLRSRLAQIMCGDVALRPSRGAKMIVLAAAAIVLPLRPAFVAIAPREASARSTPPLARAPASIIEEVESIDTDIIAPTSLADSNRRHWFVPREPFSPRVVPVLYATAVSPNGKHKVEARTGNRTTLVSVESGLPLDLSSYRIVSASFSPDSNRFATAQDDDNTVRLWDRDGGLVGRLAGSDFVITSVAFAPGGRHVAAGAADGSVLVWDVTGAGETGELVARLAGGDTPASCLRWSRQGDRLAIARSEWSNRDASSLVIWQPVDDVIDADLPFDHSIGALDWLSNDEVVVADWNGEAKYMDIESGMAVDSQQLTKDTVSAAAFSPDCPLLPRWQTGRLALGNE